MADAPVFKEKLWSQICDEVDKEPEDKTAYVFSNGKRKVVKPE